MIRILPDLARLNVEVDTDSKAKMVYEIIPTSEVVRGKKFQLKLKIHNQSKRFLFEGKVRAWIHFASHKYSEQYTFLLKLMPDEKTELPLENDRDKATFKAFSEGFAIVEFQFLEADHTAILVKENGEQIGEVVGGFHVSSPQDIHTFYALWISIILLGIMIGKEIILNWRNIVNFFN